ncbi:MAG: tetratricopeptide repeat protein [Bacteroidota bacterium]
MEFLMIQAQKHPLVDFDKVGAMGFSFGGMSTMNAKMRNANIKALVSLDGTERYVYETLEKSPYFNLGNIDVPYIHLSQKEIPKQVLEEDNIDPELNTKFDLYDSITKSKVYRLKMHHLSHSYFSTLGVLFQTRDTRKDKSDAEIMKSYQWLSQYALRFFNAYLKQDKSALNFLENTPEANGVAEGIIGKMQKEPEPRALTFQDFNEMAAKQDYEDLIPLFQTLQKEHPSLSFREIRLNNLGLKLMFHPGKTEQSIKVFLLAIHLYPESANLFDSLAEAYLYANKPKEAIVAFEKSLELNPENQNAINRLETLRD